MFCFFLPSTTLSMSSHWLVDFILSNEESAFILLDPLVHNESLFSCCFRDCLLIFNFSIYTMICLCVDLFTFIQLEVCWTSGMWGFSSNWRNFQLLFLHVFFLPISPLWYCCVYVGMPNGTSHSMLCSFSFIFPFLYSSDSVISIDLSSSSRILSCTSSNLPLSPLIIFSFQWLDFSTTDFPFGCFI